MPAPRAPNPPQEPKALTVAQLPKLNTTPSYGHDNDNDPSFKINQNVAPKYPFVGGTPIEIPRWLIKGVLPETGVAVLGGQHSAGKTQVALLLTLSLIYGSPFLERKVKRGGVLWIPAEGRNEINPRTFAARRELFGDDSNTPIPLQVPKLDDMPKSTNLEGILADVEGMVRKAHEDFAKACPDHPLRLVVIDTLAAMFPMKEENGNAEAALLMRRLGDIASTYGVVVMPIHHFGKEAGTGLRGASAFSGGADAILACKAEIDPQTGVDLSPRSLSVTKIRSGHPGPLASYSVASTIIGYDEDREAETAPYILFGDKPVVGANKVKPLSRDAQCFYAALDEVITTKGIEHRVHGDGPIVCAVHRDAVRKEFSRRYVEDGTGKATSTERNAWKRAFDGALAAGIVAGEQPNSANALIWRV